MIICFKIIFSFKNKFLNFSETKKFNTENFLTFRELQPLVSYKRVSYKKKIHVLKFEICDFEILNISYLNNLK